MEVVVEWGVGERGQGARGERRAAGGGVGAGARGRGRGGLVEEGEGSERRPKVLFLLLFDDALAQTQRRELEIFDGDHHGSLAWRGEGEVEVKGGKFDLGFGSSVARGVAHFFLVRQNNVNTERCGQIKRGRGTHDAGARESGLKAQAGGRHDMGERGGRERLKSQGKTFRGVADRCAEPGIKLRLQPPTALAVATLLSRVARSSTSIFRGSSFFPLTTDDKVPFQTPHTTRARIHRQRQASRGISGPGDQRAKAGWGERSGRDFAESNRAGKKEPRNLVVDWCRRFEVWLSLATKGSGRMAACVGSCASSWGSGAGSGEVKGRSWTWKRPKFTCHFTSKSCLKRG